MTETVGVLRRPRLSAAQQRRLLHRANVYAVRDAWERHGQDDCLPGRGVTETLLAVARAADCEPCDVDVAWVRSTMMLLTGHVGMLTAALYDRPLLATEAERLHELATLTDCQPWLEWATDALGKLLRLGDDEAAPVAG